MKLRGNVLERCRPVEINATTLKETEFLLCAIFFFVILQFVVGGFQFRDIAENLKKIIKKSKKNNEQNISIQLLSKLKYFNESTVSVKSKYFFLFCKTIMPFSPV